MVRLYQVQCIALWVTALKYYTVEVKKVRVGDSKKEFVTNSLMNICHCAALIISPSSTEQYDTSSKTHPNSQQGTS